MLGVPVVCPLRAELNYGSKSPKSREGIRMAEACRQRVFSECAHNVAFNE
jgi:hypothetical protein